jgi:5S rRNA maturation endonuclease (ribonuclease M5)
VISEQDLLARFDRVVRQREGDWLVTCPVHEDGRPSLHVTLQPDHWDLHCFAGCDCHAARDAAGLTNADLGWTNGNGNGRREVEAYSYVDEHGAPLYEVVRFDPKDFRQRRPDGSWGVKGVRRVLYRLPAVIAAVAASKRVWVVEGERDVHAMERAGAVATCNPAGAGKWADDYSAVLEGAHVVVVADDDEPGEKHALAVKASVEKHARKVSIVKPASTFLPRIQGPLSTTM